MSVARGGLYLQLECEIPGVDAVSINGRSLLAALERLGGVARERGVAPLSRFVRAHMSELSGFADDGCGSRLGERWFEPDEGLATVRSLLRGPVDVSAMSPAVRTDLESLEWALAAAARRGVAFHLFVE